MSAVGNGRHACCILDRSWLFKPVVCAPPRQPPSLLRRVVQRADGPLSRVGHEPDDGQQGGADGPAGLPGLRVVTRDGQADLLAHLEATIRLN